jgi:hypothetical protein
LSKKLPEHAQQKLEYSYFPEIVNIIISQFKIICVDEVIQEI